MDKRLHLLETFPVVGDDGNHYTVHGYEHLARLDGTPDLDEYWQPTGQAEYRLSSGERIAVDRDGVMTVEPTGVRLAGKKSEEALAAVTASQTRRAAKRTTGSTP